MCDNPDARIAAIGVGISKSLFATILDTLRHSWTTELQGLVLESNRPEIVLETVALHLLKVGTRPDMIELYRLLLLDARRFPELRRGYYDRAGGLSGMEPLSNYLCAAVAGEVLEIEDVALATEQFVYLVLGGVRARMLLGAARRPSTLRASVLRDKPCVFSWLGAPGKPGMVFNR